jgi:hypothetical protein
MMMITIEIVILAALCFVQSATFTWSGRSRASGHVMWHWFAAVFSNGTYFVTTVTIWKSIWEALTTSSWEIVVLTGVVYVMFTSLGSATMMKFMITFEKGSMRVGHKS